MHLRVAGHYAARAFPLFIGLGLASIAAPLQAAIDFETDFESPTAITDAGWVAAVNYFTPDCADYVSSPYSFDAPDNGPQVSALAPGESSQVANIYSNYDDGQHTTFCLETNVLQEVAVITEADVGEYEFTYDVELPPAEFTGDKVNGFVRVFAPGYSSVLLSVSEPSTEGTKTISVIITPEMVGGILQFGFNNYAHNYEPSGMYYDNVSFKEVVEPPVEPPEPPEGGAIRFATDFESPTAMTDDNWIAAINYFTPDCATYVLSPYSFPAPDNGPQVSALTDGFFSQVVNIYSNYDDAEQANFCLETNVFQEIFPITEADVGDYYFLYQVELPPAEFVGDKVNGFVKVLAADYSAVLLSVVQPSTEGYLSIPVSITEDMIGARLQFGFNNYSYNYEPTGMYYDNVRFGLEDWADLYGVPALDKWSLLLMTLLIGSIGLIVLRRNS
jgi:hypothetical protein